ncbi:MAG: hypothetical protein JJE35_07595 [Thermoleophilia bacterium]|nr:hypothetical protein [Thermoleophilia bacterium]
MSVLLMLATAPAATAALLAPTLTKTNPVSPGASDTPRIKGTIEEAEATAVGFGLSGLGPIAQAEGPNNIVRLYTDEDCEGPIVGQGTVEVLEDEGVPLEAPVEDPVTVFYATQSDVPETEPSDCSVGLPYRYVTAAPGAPVLNSVNPASPANQNSPRLIGSADPEATVSIYASASCTGGEAASGSGAQLGSEGIQVAVADNSETTFSATATMAGFVSDCSAAPINYQEVTPPPNPGDGGQGGGGGGVSPGTPVSPPPPPRLRTVPGGSANDNTPLVTGTAPGAATVRIYASASCDGSPVAKGSAAEFAAGIPVRVVDNAAVVLSAVSVAGETASKCSDPVVYVEDSLTPRTRITMGPAAKTAKRKAVLRFTDTTGNAPGTTFLCKVDHGKWKQCSSPLRLKKLKPKRYVVRVKASDPAGNVEIKGAKRGFKVIRRP